MQCSNIWKLDGDCAGAVLYYKVRDPKGAIYDEETKAPFEKSGFSVKGAFEVRAAPGEQTLITVLCDKHAAKLADNHPDWSLKETRPPL